MDSNCNQQLKGYEVVSLSNALLVQKECHISLKKMKIYIIYELFLCLLVVTFCPPGGFMLTVDGRASSGSGSATTPPTLWVILRLLPGQAMREHLARPGLFCAS